MASELQNRNQVIDLDSLILGRGEPRRGGQICRKCFYAYEKALNARAMIEANAVKALDAIAPAISSIAREVQPCTRSSTSCKPGITASAGKERRLTPIFSPGADVTQGRKRSPDVAVRIFNSGPMLLCKYIVTRFFIVMQIQLAYKKTACIRSYTQP